MSGFGVDGDVLFAHGGAGDGADGEAFGFAGEDFFQPVWAENLGEVAGG